MDSPVLRASNISKVYDLGKVQVHALRDVSMEVFKGDFISITGKSGSGKSTLMHIIGLLDSPSSGDMFLNNVKTSTMGENNLARIRNKEIGFVFQSFNLLERTTALDNVILTLKYDGVPRSEWGKKGTEVLNLVGLGDRLDHKPNELSGGQKQRVAIARALVNNPSILLADEPTGNLDSRTGDEIINLFRMLNDQGKTIIIVTHDEDLAEVAKRKIVLRDGERIA